MNPVEDLSFLDPAGPPPPATAAERAAVRGRGRRRRVARLGLTSAPVVLAVAAAVAVGLAISGGAGSRASVVPARPGPLNMTGAAATAPGCPAGKVYGSLTEDGVTYTAVDTEGSPFYAVCVRLRDGDAFHQVESSNGFTAFRDGSYFAVDKLGHVFANLAPGNIEGVLVLVPGRNTVKVLGIYVASVDESTPVFTLSIMRRICVPACASGKELHFRAVWDPATDTYELHDDPLHLMLGSSLPPAAVETLSPEHEGTQLAPETYHTPDGSAIYATRLVDEAYGDVIRWTVTAGRRPVTVRLDDFVDGATHQQCVLQGRSRAVDGHVVAAHATYAFQVSCPFYPPAGSGPEPETVSVAYAPGGNVAAAWIDAP